LSPQQASPFRVRGQNAAGGLGASQAIPGGDTAVLYPAIISLWHHPFLSQELTIRLCANDMKLQYRLQC